jgi:hypothetical protein
MLQKLPITPGDVITLGTLVAIGISPAEDKRSCVLFATLERNASLITYEVVDRSMWNTFIARLTELHSMSPHPELPRNDYRYTVTEKGYEMHDKDGRRVAYK